MRFNPFKRFQDHQRFCAVVRVLTHLGATFTVEELSLLLYEDNALAELEEYINHRYWRIGGVP